MKKYSMLMIAVALTGCSAYHNGKVGMTISNPDVEFVPMQARLDLNATSKVNGVAECNSILWVFNSAPERLTYGPSLQTSDGNFASSECTAGALYDAMNKSNADVIVAPQYTAAREGVLCFGHRCLFGTTKVIVSGYAGKIKSITEMDADVVHAKQKVNKPESDSSSSIF